VPQLKLAFVPSPDVKRLLNMLLDRLERRAVGSSSAEGKIQPIRPVKITLDELDLPGYYSQIDPEPRQVANEQLLALEKAGLLHLFWQIGEEGHLVEAIALIRDFEAPLYDLVGRIPANNLRARLENQLLGDRFRFGTGDWHYRAIQRILSQIKENKSPAPFNLADSDFNEDLLTALVALSKLEEETPFRNFSVRVFNDSKRFEDLKNAVIRLARLGQPAWKRIAADDLLRELNLVANPTYLLLAGDWNLVDADGQALSAGGFSPSIGLAAVQAMHLQRVSTTANKVLCIENMTTFHAMAGCLIKDPLWQRTALFCLAGNPSPACRRLLKLLSFSLPEDIPLYVWADLDYGGFNILEQLRKQVSPRFMPYNMDIPTFNRFEQFARPLPPGDRKNLERQTNHIELKDVHPVIFYLLKRGLKLEQEAIMI
jgi:hypothetical protein